MPVSPSGSNNSFLGSEGIWAVIIFALIFGWGGNGSSLFGTSRSGGATDGYILTSDFANIERKIDGVDNGLCQGFYTEAQLVNGVNANITQNGYETRLGIQQLGADLAGYTKDVTNGIQANATQGLINTNAIQQQISNCCCNNEKIALESRYEAAQANNTTLQAIEKVGDRIIDYMATEKAQTLRDENQALRLRASQEAQNNYLISQLRPYPVASYTVPNPFSTSGCAYCNG